VLIKFYYEFSTFQNKNINKKINMKNAAAAMKKDGLQQ